MRLLAGGRIASLVLITVLGCGVAPGPVARAEDPTDASSAEREVAEWVLRQGGEVILHGDNQRIRDVTKLPAGQFRIHTINFVDIHGNSGDLARFGALADLRRLYVSSRTQIRRAPGGGGAWRFLANLKQLETFVNSEPVISAPVQIDDEALKVFGAPEKLLELRVTRTAVKGLTLGIFRNLQHLDLSYSELTDEGMKQLAGLEQLLSLNLQDTRITDAGLQSLAGLKRLQILNLQGANVTDKGFAHLSGLSELRKLNLLGTRISDQSGAVLARLGKLEELSLYRTPISNLSMESLKSAANLRDLDLRYSQVTRAGVEALQKSLPDCRIVFQDGGVASTGTKRPGSSVARTEREAIRWVRDSGGKAATAADGHVHEVSLTATRVTDPDLKILRLFARLEKLDLSATQISDLGTENLSGLLSLTELRLDDTAVGDASLGRLTRLKNLQKLSLVNTRVRGPGVASLAGLLALKQLDLSGSLLEDEGLQSLGALKQLSDLSLNYSNISDDGTQHLEKLRGLERLELAGADLSDKGLGFLRSLTNLRALSLRHVRLTDAGLTNLVGLEQLRELDLATSSQYSQLGAGMQRLASLSNLKKLILDYNPVTDATLERLGGLTNLEELRLNGSDVTDLGVPHLKKLSKLHALDLYHTLVTQKGFDELKAALPACKFVWELDSSFERRRKS